MSNGSEFSDRLLFLSWESPWPAVCGGSIRTLGLLNQLSKRFEIDLIVLSREPLSDEQLSTLRSYANTITTVPMRVNSLLDKMRVIARMFGRLMPYHCAIIDVSFEDVPRTLSQLQNFPGIVYASYGHWATLNQA